MKNENFLSEKPRRFALKRLMPFALATAMAFTASGCGESAEKEEFDRLKAQYEQLEQAKTELEKATTTLEEETQKLKVKIAEYKKAITPENTLAPEEAPLPEETSILSNPTENNTVIEALSTVSREEAKTLFYKDNKLNIDSMDTRYYLEYYDSSFGGYDTGKSAGYVRDIIKDGKKYLVDANDFTQVLLSDYESIGDPYYLCTYDSIYGGKDEYDVIDGYVIEIVKHGVKYLVDAYDFTQVLLSDYESIGEPYYIMSYALWGDPSGDIGYGYVIEIVKHGIKYLVDAYDFTKVLLSDYESIGEPFYLKYYDVLAGGPEGCHGYVIEIVKHGVKYLVDASNFTSLLICEYKEIMVDDSGNIRVIFNDGTEYTHYQDEFQIQQTDILQRVLIPNDKR